MNYANRPKVMDDISRMKQHYDTIYEETSSYRQSLLVSPHCSKFQRQKVQLHQNASDKSLSDYIKPFDRTSINRTQTKQRRPRYKTSNQKQDENNVDYTQVKNNQYLQDVIEQLHEEIRYKDQRIQQLQQNLVRATSRNIMKTCASYRLQSPQVITSRRQSPLKQNKGQQISNNQHITKLENFKAMEQSNKRQIIFLTKNNQQLFEQINKQKQQNKKIKEFLGETLRYSQQLQKSIEKVKNMNKSLLEEKQKMMENYMEEIRLFKKMKAAYYNTKQGKATQVKQENNKRSLGSRPKNKN